MNKIGLVENGTRLKAKTGMNSNVIDIGFLVYHSTLQNPKCPGFLTSTFSPKIFYLRVTKAMHFGGKFNLSNLCKVSTFFFLIPAIKIIG